MLAGLDILYWTGAAVAIGLLLFIAGHAIASAIDEERIGQTQG